MFAIAGETAGPNWLKFHEIPPCTKAKIRIQFQARENGGEEL